MNWTGKKHTHTHTEARSPEGGGRTKRQIMQRGSSMRSGRSGFWMSEALPQRLYPPRLSKIEHIPGSRTGEKTNWGKKPGNILLCDLKHDMSVEATRTDVIDWVGERWLGGDRVEERHRVIKSVDSPLSWTPFPFVSDTGRFFNLPVDGAMALEIVKAGQKPELIITLDIGGSSASNLHNKL